MKLASSRIPASAVAPPVYKPKPGVKAYVRLRPTEEDPVEAELIEFSPIRQGIITLKDPLSSGRSEHSYEFSGVFDGKTDQNGLFQEVAANVVDGAAVGCSGCIIAYGQTGSGKTYSIFGGGDGPESRGLVARAMERLFIKAPSKIYEVTFLEVYQEQIYDLAAGQDRKALDMNESEGTPQIQELSRTRVRDPSEVLRILREGLAIRMSAATAANAGSSRSHTVFTVDVLAPPTQAIAHSNCSLSFVDLAGSERLAKSKAEGARFKEAVAINSSLTTLGKVVLTLAGGSHPQHIPIRDSKLTRLLAPALLGNSQVAVLATLHPKLEHYEECLNTLAFADRCKNLSPNPRVHFLDGGQQNRKIRMLQAQVKSLEQMVKRQKTLMMTRAAEAAKHVDKAIADALEQGLGEQGRSPSHPQALLPAPTHPGGSGPGPHFPSSFEVPGGASMAPGASSSSAGPELFEDLDPDDDGESATRTASASGAYASEEGSSAQGRSADSPHLSPEPSKELLHHAGVGPSGRTAAELRAAGRDRDVAPTSVLAGRRDALTTRATKNPMLKALQEVQGQREIESAKQANLLRRMQRLQEEQRQIKEMDHLRLSELDQVDRKQKFLDDRSKELKAQIQAMQENAEHQLKQHRQEVEAVREKKIQHLDNSVTKLFRSLEKRLDFLHQHRLDYQARRMELEQEFKKLSQEKQDQRQQRLSALRADWRTRLVGLRQTQDAVTEQYRKEKRAFDAMAASAGGELVGLFQLVQLLSALICDAEEGQFPTFWRDGTRQVVLPSECVPNLPDAESFPSLAAAKAKAQTITSAFDKLTTRSSSRPSSGARVRGSAPSSASRLRQQIAAAAAAAGTSQPPIPQTILAVDEVLRRLHPSLQTSSNVAPAPTSQVGKDPEQVPPTSPTGKKGGQKIEPGSPTSPTSPTGRKFVGDLLNPRGDQQRRSSGGTSNGTNDDNGSANNTKTNNNNNNNNTNRHNSNNSNTNTNNNANNSNNNSSSSSSQPPPEPCTTEAEVMSLLGAVESEKDLQSICLKLRSAVLDDFCPKKEKERMRMEIQMDLEREATLAYIAQLEGQRNALRVAVADEVSKQSKCRARLASTREAYHNSRASTPASSSRGSRPSTAKSRLPTRPSSAGRVMGGRCNMQTSFHAWNRTLPLEVRSKPVAMQ